MLNSIAKYSVGSQPIFALRKLEWEPRSSKVSKLKNRRISKVVASNNFIVVATNACSIIRFKVNDLNKDPEEIEISNKPEDVIDNLFLDYGGFHLIVCMKSGDNYYFCNSKSFKARKISKLMGNIECIAFDRSNVSDSVTKLLAGTSMGVIHEIIIENTGKERSCQIVYQLNEPLPISSIFFEYISCYDVEVPSRSANAASETCLFLMFSTSNPTRLYHFAGGQTFHQLFSDNSIAAHAELPGEISKAELLCYSHNGSAKAQKFALMTGAGIYNGKLIDNNRLAEFPNEANMLPYVVGGAEVTVDIASFQAIAIGVTEFHFLVLRADRYQALSSLNGELIQEDIFRNSDGTPLGIVRDPLRNFNFIYTNSCLFQVVATDEDRNVWSTYLTKALSTGDDLMFDNALAHSKIKEQKYAVMKSRAEFCITQNNWDKAASCFSHCGLSVDEVILKLLNVFDTVSFEREKCSNKVFSSDVIWLTALEKLTAIKIYLFEILKVIPTAAKSQRAMICIWLCEMYLHQLTSLGNSAQIEDEIRSFMRTHRNSLDLNTVLNLLLSRNNRKLLLFFSRIVGDYHGVINLLITEKQYVEALEVINSAPFEKIGHFVYDLLPVLIEHVPLQLVQVLLAKPQYSVSSLMPTIVRYCTIFDRSSSHSKVSSGEKITNYALMYFEELFSKVGIQVTESADSSGDWSSSPIDLNEWSTWMEPIALNTMMWLLTKYDHDEKKLVSFVRYFCVLRNGGFALDLIQFDAEFLLRQCRLFNRRKGAIFALLLVNNPLPAIREALCLDLELAKSIATKCPCGEEKKLWLEIARFIIAHFMDMRTAIALIAESGGILKIEDLLPILSDFTEIDFLKDDICKSLSKCTSMIDSIKSDMVQLTESVDNTLKELDEMKNRALTTASTDQRCGVCMGYLFDTQFYLFPCSHGFHGYCLLSESRKFLCASQLCLVRDLETKMKVLAVKGKEADSRAKVQLEQLQLELDSLIASDCLLCGSATVDSLNVSLMHPLESESAEIWNL